MSYSYAGTCSTILVVGTCGVPGVVGYAGDGVPGGTMVFSACFFRSSTIAALTCVTTEPPEPSAVVP